MEPLHTSYDNQGSWKLTEDPEHTRFDIVHNPFPAIIGGGILCAICLISAIIAFIFLPREAEIKPALIVICVLTGFVVPAIMIVRATSYPEDTPLISYFPSKDLLIVSDPALQIKEASARVSFSSEYFKGKGDDDRFELNLVLDSNRLKFLSHNSSNGFDTLIRDINKIGFVVAHHEIRI